MMYSALTNVCSIYKEQIKNNSVLLVTTIGGLLSSHYDVLRLKTHIDDPILIEILNFCFVIIVVFIILILVFLFRNIFCPPIKLKPINNKIETCSNEYPFLKNRIIISRIKLQVINNTDFKITDCFLTTVNIERIFNCNYFFNNSHRENILQSSSGCGCSKKLRWFNSTYNADDEGRIIVPPRSKNSLVDVSIVSIPKENHYNDNDIENEKINIYFYFSDENELLFKEEAGLYNIDIRLDGFSNGKDIIENFKGYLYVFPEVNKNTKLKQINVIFEEGDPLKKRKFRKIINSLKKLN